MSNPTFRDVDWYDEPHYYDILLDEDTAPEADFVEAMMKRHGPAHGRDVFEPACGSGRLIAELARRGYRMSGLDLSQSMLEYTRSRLKDAGLSARLVQGSMDSFRLPRRVDLAYCFVSSFRYLRSESSAVEHLDCIARSLRKGGIYLLGLHLTQYDWNRMQHERWVGKRDETRVVCNLRSWPPDEKRRTERLRSRVTVQEGSQTQRFETGWTFRTYDAAQLRRVLRKSPALEHVTTYDFTYELGSERVLDDEQLDCVLVLKKR